MAEDDKTPQERIKQLRRRVRRLRRRVEELETAQPAAAPATAPLAKKPNPVSPLAPKNGFPALPVIDGVRFASGAAGVKYQNRTDVMLAEVAPGSAIAGVFTRSATRSAPVLDCQAKLAKLHATPLTDRPVGIVVNSGNSNAFTGRAGDASVERVCGAAAEVLGTTPGHILTASTGVIGVPLPDERIRAVLGDLTRGLSVDGAEGAAKAIMTTDTFPKGAFAEIDIGGRRVRIAGFAKGSGMIAPDMATMLVYIFTDCAITQGALQTLVSLINRTTFNAITVDSDTSTSDSLVACATGRAGNRLIERAEGADAAAFAAGLEKVMKRLAHLVVRDGEGATKFVEVAVGGAHSDNSAQIVARAIADSPLVKTAIAGEDPNWGRIVMAIGKSGEPAERDRIAIRFGDIVVAEGGWVSPNYREEDGAGYMKHQNLRISVDLGIGAGTARVWTCDLTHQYITINADYRS